MTGELSWEPNGAGGRRYYSDEIGDGVLVWDTSLVAESTIMAALLKETELNHKKFQFADMVKLVTMPSRVGMITDGPNFEGEYYVSGPGLDDWYPPESLDWHYEEAVIAEGDDSFNHRFFWSMVLLASIVAGIFVLCVQNKF